MFNLVSVFFFSFPLSLGSGSDFRPGRDDSRPSSHKNVTGERINAHVVNWNNVWTSSSNGTYPFHQNAPLWVGVGECGSTYLSSIGFNALG